MVGDDIETDVLAARRQGLTGVMAKTGKYLPRTHRATSGAPDHVLDSFAACLPSPEPSTETPGSPHQLAKPEPKTVAHWDP